MRLEQETADIKQPLLQVLREFPELKLAILYESVAAGTARKDSDVDLGVAIDSRDPIPRDRLLQISTRADKYLKREVHVRDLSAAPGVFLQIIQRDATARAELIIRMLDFVEDMLLNVRTIRLHARLESLRRCFTGITHKPLPCAAGWT